MKRIVFFLCILPLTAVAQVSRLGENVRYGASMSGMASSGTYAPFWFTANRYGLSTSNTESFLMRASLDRSTRSDSAQRWRIGYGADFAVAAGMSSHLILQQLYAEVEWKVLRLSIGQKERPLELLDDKLSCGAMTSGINARPLPQVRLELPDFWAVPGTHNWFSLKAHFAMGAYTDSKWQRSTAGAQGLIYTNGSLYHSKELLLRIGNEERFPLTLAGGLEMCSQFGGEGWNMGYRADDSQSSSCRKLFNGLSSIWHAIIPGGSDINDGDFPNSEGNHLGSWHLRANWKGRGWSAAAYMEHFFEDESQMFWQYGWKDYLLGIEVHLPHNPLLSSFLYEHLGTMDQSGPVYHDARENLPVQISGLDEYYNNHVYGAWQHAGFVMGNPLLLSPIYNKDKRIYCYYNRVNAHHLGLRGEPTGWMGWRVLYSTLRTLGTYHVPTIDPCHAHYLLCELTWRPKFLPSLSVTGTYGFNGGSLIGRSHGGMLTLAYQGLINKK
ncbi:MAG: capsule assembly Wzi family protein [Bacteroidaceae bacterium]